MFVPTHTLSSSTCNPSAWIWDCCRTQICCFYEVMTLKTEGIKKEMIQRFVLCFVDPAAGESGGGGREKSLHSSAAGRESSWILCARTCAAGHVGVWSQVQWMEEKLKVANGQSGDPEAGLFQRCQELQAAMQEKDAIIARLEQQLEEQVEQTDVLPCSRALQQCSSPATSPLVPQSGTCY